LRERPEDIGVLVRHFVDLYARRMNKGVERVPQETLEALLRYPWPGNVRELQNFVERAVILSPDKVLRAPLAELRAACPGPTRVTPVMGTGAITLREAEKHHILQALTESNWVVGGPHGAATRLGVQRTTLISKMQRLGVMR
jgi:formate hydrogenlyase transcriptional activator